MDIALTRKAIEAEKRYEAAPVQVHLRAEALVAGAGRESVEILLTDARTRIKSAQTQTDRVIAEGECVCQAAYKTGGETAARAVEATAPVSCQFDIKGAMSGMANDIFIENEEMQARYENGHIVFDVYVTLRAGVTSLVPVDVIVDAQSGNALETKYEEIRSVKLSAENTVTEILSQTVSLPAALDARYVLMDWARPMQIDFQKEPGGLRVTGSVFFETLISTGRAARPVQLVKYRLPVDRFLEMPEWLMNHVNVNSAIVREKAYVNQAENGEDASLQMEAEMEISVFAMGEDSARALTDVFSTEDTQVTGDTETYEVCVNVNRISFEEPFRASMLLKDGAGSAGEVCAVKTHASVGEILHDGAQTTVTGVVNAQVVYMSANGDRLLCENQDLPFEVGIAAQTDPDVRVSVQAIMPEANALMSDRIELKCALNITADQRIRGRMNVVNDVYENGENLRKKGIVIVWPADGEDEWTLAKRYLTKVEKVQNASNGSLANQNPLVLRL